MNFFFQYQVSLARIILSENLCRKMFETSHTNISATFSQQQEANVNAKVKCKCICELLSIVAMAERDICPQNFSYQRPCKRNENHGNQ
jgi:hypothetical protein